MKKVLITVGGTGGHIFPAMALAKELQKASSNLELLFVGGGLQTNRYFDRASFHHHDIPCGALRKNPFLLVRNCGRIARGFIQSRSILKEFKPDAVVGFGSYHTVPMVLAALTERIPLFLHEANRVPGKVNRLFSRYAEATGVHFSDSASFLKGNVLNVKIPLREGYRFGSCSKSDARKYFGLDPEKKTLLVFGGSQGAQGINRIVFETIPMLPESLRKGIQVLHFTGDPDMTRQMQSGYAAKGITAYVRDLELHMDMAWQAADLIISRSGAVTLAEQMEFEVPGILIPYPFATDNHQEKNADFVVEKMQGAVKFIEKDLSPATLSHEITSFFYEGNKRLKAMQRAINEFKKTSSARELSELILTSIGE